MPGTLTERARLFANMLFYAFDDGAIQGQSFESLELTLSGGLVVDDAIAGQAGGADRSVSDLLLPSAAGRAG